MTTTVTFQDLPGLAGTNLGFSGYREITQEQVNLFADAADDHQWIHVDPERAKDGPFGAPIAHGYLSLALIIPFSEELLDVDGVTTKVNYGLDKVRFPSPVKVGSRVRMGTTVREVTEVPGGYQLTLDNVIEVEGATKPAVAATTLFRFYA
ncbi:MaoC family dehydratase [Georgenia ruanii]|uniref:MaoC family dehydratase n=1 Tax=Georgenia ruanii TaxID=348442 RepID=A0A7J9UU63_9MICO|nr:MaoC family dehydratase [Georgenia ruanii]MPV88171.1 MaoC family dehydratase [Georgenia ruanii]